MDNGRFRPRNQRVYANTSRYAEAILRYPHDGAPLTLIDDMESRLMTFHDFVTFVGPPGSGKSTLASAVYCFMRGGEKIHYFGLNTFTRGIWVLNSETKLSGALNDMIDVLDQQGLDRKGETHFISMLGMILGKVIVFCSREIRIDAVLNALELLCSTITFARENGVVLPPPVIYIPLSERILPDDEVQLTLEYACTRAEVPDLLKHLYPELCDADIIIYSLPEIYAASGDVRPLHHDGYMAAVGALVREWTAVPASIPVVTRTRYARQVLQALNEKSPEMVFEARRLFFTQAMDAKCDQMQASSLEVVRFDHAAHRMDTLVTYPIFKLYESYSFAETFSRQMLECPFFDPRFSNLVVRKCSECILTVGEQVIDLYQLEYARCKSQLLRNQAERAGIYERDFLAFVDQKLVAYRQSIVIDIPSPVFEAKLRLPPTILDQITNQSALLRRRMHEEFACLDEAFPAGFLLGTNPAARWGTIVEELRLLSQRYQDRCTAEQERLRMQEEMRQRDEARRLNEWAAAKADAVSEYDTYVTSVLGTAERAVNINVSKQQLDAGLVLSAAVVQSINTKAIELRSRITTQFQKEPDADFLRTVDYSQRWSQAAGRLRNAWSAAETLRLQRASDEAAEAARRRSTAFTQRVDEYDAAFRAYVSVQLSAAAARTPFQVPSDQPLPLDGTVCGVIETERSRYLSLLQSFDRDLAVQNTRLQQVDIRAAWKVEANHLQAKWTRMVQDAKWVTNIKVHGDLTCPNESCKQMHDGSSVTHRNCKKPGCVWFWVDGPTNACICDGCDTVMHINGFCCGRCQTSLNCQVVPLRK